ncbi:MAG: family 10 glycosylhydrolase [Ruminococcus sp.]|nr:family 10 glycosylhydrolase [Ruminococcus sp.]
MKKTHKLISSLILAIICAFFGTSVFSMRTDITAVSADKVDAVPAAATVSQNTTVTAAGAPVPERAVSTSSADTVSTAVTTAPPDDLPAEEETSPATTVVTTAIPAPESEAGEPTEISETEPAPETETEPVTTSIETKVININITTTTTAPPEPVRTVINYTTQKAMWVSVFELNRILQGKTQAQFTQGFREICNRSKAMGINTLYVHTRPFGDSFYPSNLFPWSAYVTGTFGRSPRYDPLKIMVDTAHSCGLSVHAWINPYRVSSLTNIYSAPDSYLVKKWLKDPASYPEYVSYAEVYGTYWLNPGIPEVRSLIIQGVKEIVNNYEVDGIHIDDYFYPTNDTSYDAAAYAKYGGGKTLTQWRLFNCTATVKAIYDTVKAADGRLLFGISPQGNYENNYLYLYADVDLWLSQKGYCDYLCPQVYYSYDFETKPFKDVLSQWASLPRAEGVKLLIGLAPANIWLSKSFYDQTGIIGSQITDSLAVANGVALFRYDSLYADAGSVFRADNEINAITKALK